MARPIKRLRAEPDALKEFRRRSRSTTIGVRDRERAEIILRRLDGAGVEVVAEQLVRDIKAYRRAQRRPKAICVEGRGGSGDRLWSIGTAGC